MTVASQDVEKAGGAALYSELMQSLGRHAEALSLEEMLAIMAIVLGNVMSLQDRRTGDSDATLRWVLRHLRGGKASGDKGGMLGSPAGNA